MWLIHKIYLSMSLLSLTYLCLIYLMAFSDEHANCKVITRIIWIDEFLFLCNNINSLIIWQYPIMYIFWPNRNKLISSELRDPDFQSDVNTTSIRNTSAYSIVERQRSKMHSENNVVGFIKETNESKTSSFYDDNMRYTSMIKSRATVPSFSNH